MKLIRSVRLRLKDSNSERLYEIDLVENDALGADRRYLINFRHGRPGSTLREGSRTATPLDHTAAEQLFDSMVVSRLNSGYRRDGEDAEPQAASAAAGQASSAAASVAEAPPLPASLAPPDGRTTTLLARLETLARSPWISKDLDRLIWRIGQLRIAAATPELLRLAQRQGPEHISYSLVWALARTAGEVALPVLEGVSRQATMANVRDLARFALVSPLMGAAQRRDPATEDLDAGVAHAAATHDAGAIAGALTELAARDVTRPGPAMTALARLAQGDPGLHKALAAALLLLPARPPFLIGLRRVFKYAEMADDAALFAATAHRFETATPMYSVRQTGRTHIWAPELGAAIRMDEDRGRPDARLGLSLATLLYLKRRSWRALRKRGEVGDPSFTDMAAACLLALRPQDLASPVTRTQWRRNDAGRWTRQQRVSGPLARNWTASQLLYRHDPAVRFGSARLTSDEAPDARPDTPGEAFPELWGMRPDLALDLACDSPCQPVSALGVRILKTAPAALRAAPATALARLLRAHDIAAQALGLAEARERLAAGEADPALLVALLQADSADARRLAVRRIDASPSLPWSDPDLAFAVLLTSHDDLAENVLRWAGGRAIPESDTESFVSRLVAWLEACPIAPDAALDVKLRLLRQRLAVLWADRPLPVPANAAARLLTHAAPGVVAVGVDMLALADVDAGVLSSDMWQTLLGSSSTDVQTAALRLFNRLDDEALAGHAPLVVAFATAPVPELRQAARPLVARLAARDPALSEKLGRELVDSLFRAAPDDAWPQDMVDLLYAAMPQQVAALDAGILWRLLQARAKGAQLLGATELPNRPFATFSVRQIARLGAHSHLAVRQWVMAAFADDPARFQAEAADAVLLIESDWDDTRAFARTTFDQWPQHAWDLPTLAVVTDSIKPDVLAFARHLLRSRLSPEDAPEQLSRLLEHPAQSMHLLATELLTENAVASEAAFERLLPLARMIMLQVHKGRIAKDRISAFLRSEALRDAGRAARIAPLFSDLSLAGVARDRAFAILALRDITGAHPDIVTPLVRRAAPERAA